MVWSGSANGIILKTVVTSTIYLSVLSVECRSVVATCLSWLAIIDFEVRAVIVVRSFNIHLHSQTCPTCVHTYIHTHTHTHTHL